MLTTDEVITQNQSEQQNKKNQILIQSLTMVNMCVARGLEGSGLARSALNLACHPGLKSSV